MIFTVAIPGNALPAELYQKVTVFVAETRPLAKSLERAGIPPDRIRVIHPGVDLARFTPAHRPAGPFRIIFASSPAAAGEFAWRGIPLIIDAARRCEDVEFVLLWRQWGDLAGMDRALSALNPPRNVVIYRQDVSNIAALFQTVHATLWMAAENHGKSCPNSVIEGLAAGCPTVVSHSCGVAELVNQSGAGLAIDRTVEALAAAVQELRTSWTERTMAARRLAEAHFDVGGFLRAYRDLYRLIAAATDGAPVR